MILTKGTAKQAGFNPVKIIKISEVLSSWIKRGITRTQCVLVARKGTIVLKEALGLLDNRDENSKLTTDAIFPLASITKPLTAACLMLLVDDAKPDSGNRGMVSEADIR